jgi:hypothetical protein
MSKCIEPAAKIISAELSLISPGEIVKYGTGYIAVDVKHGFNSGTARRIEAAHKYMLGLIWGKATGCLEEFLK